VYGLDRHLPPFIALESSSLAVMIRSFDTLYRTSQGVSGSNEEPMMNLVSWYDDGSGRWWCSQGRNIARQGSTRKVTGGFWLARPQ